MAVGRGRRRGVTPSLGRLATARTTAEGRRVVRRVGFDRNSAIRRAGPSASTGCCAAGRPEDARTRSSRARARASPPGPGGPQALRGLCGEHGPQPPAAARTGFLGQMHTSREFPFGAKGAGAGPARGGGGGRGRGTQRRCGRGKEEKGAGARRRARVRAQRAALGRTSGAQHCSATAAARIFFASDREPPRGRGFAGRRRGRPLRNPRSAHMIVAHAASLGPRAPGARARGRETAAGGAHARRGDRRSRPGPDRRGCPTLPLIPKNARKSVGPASGGARSTARPPRIAPNVHGKRAEIHGNVHAPRCSRQAHLADFRTGRDGTGLDGQPQATTRNSSQRGKTVGFLNAKSNSSPLSLSLS